MNILVVDDDLKSSEQLIVYLRDQGHRLEQANGGRAALAILDKQTFDRMFVDLMMPDMDGMEVVREMRKDLRHANTWVGVMTAQASSISGHVEDVLAPGAFITKPIVLEELP